MSAARTTCCRRRARRVSRPGWPCYDFLKRTTLLGCDRASFAASGPAAAALARAEGLEAHALAVERRLERPRASGPEERITALELDQKSIVRWSPQVEHERNVAIFDLLEDNRFRLVDGFAGPYRLLLSLRESNLVLPTSKRTVSRPGRGRPATRPFRARGQGLLHDLRQLFPGDQGRHADAHRSDRHGAARPAQRRLRHTAAGARGTGRHRPRHGPAPVHAGCVLHIRG